MHELPEYHRLLLLAEGALGVHSSKTAAVLLRYRPNDVVAIVDSAAVGKDPSDLVPWAPAVPIVADLSAAESLKPDALFVGIAPVGGGLPAAMRSHVRDALRSGIDVVSGLHDFLADDDELSAAARASGARIHDLRRPPRRQVVASGRARGTRCRRVLTVGSDASVGKMVTAVELASAARRRRLDARFVATGQTGIMVAGRGIAVDACIADFAAGAAEDLVLDAADADICFVEGQGSIAHPGFSAVTLALLHGTCPDAMVLVHAVGRTHCRATPRDPLPSLRQLVIAYEQAAGWLHPAAVVAVALNSVGQPEDFVAAEARRIESELSLPVADPIRDGCDRLLDAVLPK